VQVSRVHSSDTQVFINDSRLKGVTNFDVSFDRETADLRGLHSLHIEDRINTEPEKVAVNLSWIMGNDTSDPFFSVATGQIVSVENFTIEKKDIVGSEVIEGAYLTSYEVAAAIGDTINGKASYEANRFYTGAESLAYEDQSNDFNLSVFLPSKIVIDQTSIEGNVSSSGVSIQSFSVQVPIPRTTFRRIGTPVPKTRYPEIPVVGTTSFSILKNTGASFENDAVVLSKGNFTVSLYDCAGSGEISYHLQDCNLSSISESLDLDGNETVDFNYSFNVLSGFRQS